MLMIRMSDIGRRNRLREIDMRPVPARQEFPHRHGLACPLLVAVGEDTQLERDHKTAPGSQVDLVQWRGSRGREILRRTGRRRAVIGEYIGDVFTVEEVIDAEADLRLVENGMFANGVVQEEIYIIVRRN